MLPLDTRSAKTVDVFNDKVKISPFSFSIFVIALYVVGFYLFNITFFHFIIELYLSSIVSLLLCTFEHFMNFAQYTSKLLCIIVYCVVPENIHTPTTEGISHRTPPPPRIFHFQGIFLTPPPLRKFLKYRIHPHPPLEKFYFKRTPQKSV